MPDEPKVLTIAAATNSRVPTTTVCCVKRAGGVFGVFLLLIFACLPSAVRGGSPSEDLRAFCEKMLADQKDYDARRAGISGGAILDRLRKYMDGRPTPEILPLLQHPEWEIRQGATQTLSQTNHLSFPTVQESLVASMMKETNIYALSALVACAEGWRYERAVPALVRIMQECPNDEIRRKTVYALRWNGGVAAIPHLLNALRDPSPRVRAAVPYQLGEMKDRRATAGLCEIAAREQGDLRIGVVQALGMIGDPAAAPTLRSLLVTDDKKLLAQALWSLGRAYDKETVHALGAFLDVRDSEIANAARISLCDIGTDEVFRLFLSRYRASPTNVMNVSSLFGLYHDREDRRENFGEQVKPLQPKEFAALTSHLSVVGRALGRGMCPDSITKRDIRSIKAYEGVWFVNTDFGASGVDFIVISEPGGQFSGGTVIGGWIH